MRLDYLKVANVIEPPVAHRPRLEDTEWWRVMMANATEYQVAEERAGRPRPQLSAALGEAGYRTVLSERYRGGWPNLRTLDRWEQRWAELNA
jgi:hypothetical protein